ncbi:hypothetical protein [Streptomyces pseudovenezuelae]|uniref:hypothetical protein n=1 Tax=Streptomyces pseudovenezuelae TaxID=67350 RepID=UPI0036EEA91A
MTTVKPNTSRLDREIRQTQRKIEAVHKEEMWPLAGKERRAVMGALAGGSQPAAEGKRKARTAAAGGGPG